MNATAPASVRVDAEQLAASVADIFTALGIARGDAALVAHDIVLADLEGVASHGVMLVPMYVDRILKGARPGELPILQPARFQLVVNKRTAQALGIAFPQALLSWVDEVIE